VIHVAGAAVSALERRRRRRRTTARGQRKRRRKRTMGTQSYDAEFCSRN